MAESQALIIFGDGVQALFYEERHAKSDRHGRKVQPILLVPSIELAEKYQLTEEDLVLKTEDNRRAIWMEYPVKHLKWLNKSKSGAVLLIFCAFDGAETELMNYYDEILQWTVQTDKIIARLRAQISLLQRDLEDTTSNQIELMRKQKEMSDVHEKKRNEEESGGE